MRQKLPDGWQEYCCAYRYKGKEWSFEVVAQSEEDARGRLAAMALGRVDGKLVMEIPYFPAAGLWTRAVVWVKNHLRT